MDFYKPLPPTLEKLIASENTMLLKEVVTFEPRRLFSWNNVPGSDSEGLIRFLGDNLHVAWVENAKILKPSDGKTIYIFKDDNTAEITLDEKKEKATLKISDGQTHDLKAKKENGKLNIYENRTFKPDECSDEFFTYIEISDIDLEDGVIRSSKQLKCKNAPSRARMILKEGDIIISLTRPTRGAVAIVPVEYDGAIGTTGFAVVRAIEEYILPEYLHIILISKFIKEQFEKRMSGSNYPAISRPELELIEIPVPSFSIQEQVIETIKRIKRDKKQKSQQIDELKALIETFNIEIENNIDILLKKQIETRHDGES